jgi:GTP-binding protein EngB required for normal cell division
MSNIVGLCGNSNVGKSTSLKYLNPEETFIISCTNKQLQIPGFRKKYKKVSVENGELKGNWFVSTSYLAIQKIIKILDNKRKDIKVLVIDDANYLLSKETFDSALDKGYEKFTIQAKNYVDLINALQELRDDLTVVFISHIENYGTDVDPEYRLWTTGK